MSERENESDDGYRKWHHVHTVDDVATFQDFRIVCFVAFDEGYDHFSSYSWQKKNVARRVGEPER